ncbi:hypothetical protein [Paraburkholderia lacunae]|uniref:Uncharacterized protein n=1 Tax=Paraburkholderia lacunae TaxID=2211104 RepID=A0A370N7M3_9BURK|nr:hypothetical protein [Paraburkholderia lacunae]RDK01617.1 hypothetical protein DLM46_17605 [Paraburkholderia lacunae]
MKTNVDADATQRADEPMAEAGTAGHMGLVRMGDQMARGEIAHPSAEDSAGNATAGGPDHSGVFRAGDRCERGVVRESSTTDLND